MAIRPTERGELVGGDIVVVEKWLRHDGPHE